MTPRPIRIAARAILLHENRLLLVNAFGGVGAAPDDAAILWCAPGGGAEPHSSLPENLTREVHEETGLHITVGPPCLINEFHNPDDGFHQVEVFFRCTVAHGTVTADWRDPEQIVTRRRWVTRDELQRLRFKPDSLSDVAWARGLGYDPLERLVKP